MIVEISSYPKSGNTLLRHIINNRFNVMPVDIHQFKFKEEYIKINDSRVCFYKSHVVNFKRKPDKIIYIYRNPMDVFLSCMNYFYLKEIELSKQSIYHTNKFFEKIVPVTKGTSRLRYIFQDYNASSVDELKDSGKLEVLFDRFTSDLGGGFFVNMLGRESNYMNHINCAIDNNAIMIKYEDLISDKNTVMNRCFRELGFDVDFNVNEDEISQKTLKSGNPFFWKAKSGTRNDYISEDKIANFESFHFNMLNKLNYI